MIWPFKKEPKEEYKAPEFKSLRFGKLEYSPQKDITPHEVALMLPMFITMFSFNRQEYIENNNLLRHFKKVEE